MDEWAETAYTLLIDNILMIILIPQFDLIAMGRMAVIFSIACQCVYLSA